MNTSNSGVHTDPHALDELTDVASHEHTEVGPDGAVAGYSARRTLRLGVELRRQLKRRRTQFLLGFVALLPFPTSVLADYGNNTPVVVLYAFNVGIITVLQLWLWVHAYRAGLTERLDADVYLLVKRNLYPVPVVMGASIVVAFFSPLIAMFMWILIWPASQLTDRIASRAPKKVGPKQVSPKPARRSRDSAS